MFNYINTDDVKSDDTAHPSFNKNSLYSENKFVYMSFFSEPTNAAKNKTMFCKDLYPNLKNTFGTISNNQNFKSKQLCKKSNCIIEKRTYYSSKFLLNLRFSPNNNSSASFQNNHFLIFKKGFNIFVASFKAKDSTTHKKTFPSLCWQNLKISKRPSPQ